MEAVQYREVEPTTRCSVKPASRKTYRVGDDGSFWSRAAMGVWVRLKPSPQQSGHMRVYLGKGNENMRFLHILILEAFVGPRPAGLHGCHEDDDPANNRLENLYWGTRKQNIADAIRNGKKMIGEKASASKLSADAVLDIVARCRAGETHRSVAERHGVGAPNVQAIMYGISWSALTGIPRKVKGAVRRSRVSALNDETVLDILARCRRGEMQIDVAALHGVDPSSVNSILAGRSWNRVTGLPKARSTGGTLKTLCQRKREMVDKPTENNVR